jgi:hypothetical protein
MSDNIRIKYNDENEELYCLGCKNRINLGEKYIAIVTDEKEEISFHFECMSETPEEHDGE